MNLGVLDQRIAAIGRHPDVDPVALVRFRDAVASEDDWGLFRVNPLRFAKTHGLSETVATDLFVLAAREGLFDLSLLEVCPYCGWVTSDRHAWGAVTGGQYHCATCQAAVDANLDDYVAVTFSVSSAVHVPQLDRWRDLGAYRRYHIFGEYRPGARVVEYVGGRARFDRLPIRGELARDVATAGEDELFVSTYEFPFSASIPVATGGATEVTVVVDSEGMHWGGGSVAPGLVRLRVRNQTGQDLGVIHFARRPAELIARLQETPATWGPFLTASRLLSLQRFREVYRVQELPPELRLKIRSLTLLFTDLSGSTALYESTGDVTAFDIVREHFELLGACVRAHEGAVIKTMGDAIMASFPRPEQALEAARAMVDAMVPVTERAAKFGHRVGLKVGVHEGPALVVNADDRLDYFGQTVNVAARVQGLAGAGEVWVTKGIFDTAGRVLVNGGYRSETQRVPLKGVEGLVEVVRCARPA